MLRQQAFCRCLGLLRLWLFSVYFSLTDAASQQSKEVCNLKYNRLVKWYEKAVDRLKIIIAEREMRTQRDRDLRILISSIKEQPLVLETWDKDYGSRYWKLPRYKRTT